MVIATGRTQSGGRYLALPSVQPDGGGFLQETYMRLYFVAALVSLSLIFLAAQITKSNTERYKRIFGQGHYHAH